MANVVDYKNTETGINKSKKQQRRQSKDFKEIWSTQSEMNVADDDWDQMFHNWDNPKECKQNRVHHKCSVCEHLRTVGYVTRVATGEIYGNRG